MGIKREGRWRLGCSCVHLTPFLSINPPRLWGWRGADPKALRIGLWPSVSGLVPDDDRFCTVVRGAVVRGWQPTMAKTTPQNYIDVGTDRRLSPFGDHHGTVRRQPNRGCPSIMRPFRISWDRALMDRRAGMVHVYAIVLVSSWGVWGFVVWVLAINFG